MNVGSCFSGIGLLDYGLCLAGFEHAWGCEQDEWRRKLWEQRFRAPCHPDIRAFDAGWGRVDLVAGGFPCKGASSAGKREGFDHPETVLWREMARAVRELRPRYVLVENVRDILSVRGGGVWGEVVGDLATLGFDIEWDCLPAAAVGAPHLRDRVIAIATYSGQCGRDTGVGEVWGRQPDIDRGAPADACGRRRQGEGRRWALESYERSVGADDQGRACAVADASRDAEGGTGPSARPNRERIGEGTNAVTDPEGRPTGRCSEVAAGRLEAIPHGINWGGYEPAIRRWEAVHGPAPEPLVGRVDDRSAARVVRSRLSALGDGVQVQVGYLAGVYIRALEDERMRSAA